MCGLKLEYGTLCQNNLAGKRHLRHLIYCLVPPPAAKLEAQQSIRDIPQVNKYMKRSITERQSMIVTGSPTGSRCKGLLEGDTKSDSFCLILRRIIYDRLNK